MRGSLTVLLPVILTRVKPNSEKIVEIQPLSLRGRYLQAYNDPCKITSTKK